MVSRLEGLKQAVIEKRRDSSLTEVQGWLLKQHGIRISIDKLSRHLHRWGAFMDQRRRTVRRAAKRARETTDFTKRRCPMCGNYPLEPDESCSCGFKMGERKHVRTR